LGSETLIEQLKERMLCEVARYLFDIQLQNDVDKEMFCQYLSCQIVDVYICSEVPCDTYTERLAQLCADVLAVISCCRFQYISPIHQSGIAAS